MAVCLMNDEMAGRRLQLTCFGPRSLIQVAPSKRMAVLVSSCRTVIAGKERGQVESASWIFHARIQGNGGNMGYRPPAIKRTYFAASFLLRQALPLPIPIERLFQSPLLEHLDREP